MTSTSCKVVRLTRASGSRGSDLVGGSVLSGTLPALLGYPIAADQVPRALLELVGHRFLQSLAALNQCWGC